MKRCPTCNRTYEDATLRYCLNDGSLLTSDYDPQATQRVDLPRATSGQPTEVMHVNPSRARPPSPRSFGIAFIVIASLVVLVIGGAVAVFLLASKSAPPQAPPNAKGNNNQNANRPVVENTSEASRLVGAWRANVKENGDEAEINYTFNADGTSSNYFIDVEGRSDTSYGTWRYSDGILYEEFSDGASGKGSVEWIDSDTYDLTIIDNGVPAYNGIRRRYYRVK